MNERRKKLIDSVLTDWGYWASKRSDYSEIAKATGQIHCSSLFHLTQGQLEEVETVEHRKRFQVYPDETLMKVTTTINSMPTKLKKILIAKYRWSDRVSIKEKSKRLKICSKTFYNRLEAAHDLFNLRFDWALL